MATPKQYELLFLLKAQMDSAFSSGFNTARGYVAQLQSKVNAYNQTLRDIKAYQTHTNKLNELSQKYSETKQKLDELEKTISGDKTATEEQTAEKQKLEQALERLNRQMDSQKQKIDAEETALKNAKVNINNLADAESELRAKAKEVNTEMERFADFRNEINDFANTFTALKMGADLVFNAVSKVDQAIISSIQSAAELQYTMSAVRAVSGATQEETAQLTSLAKEMGATTIYTASQCAESLETMTLAGMDVQEMMSGLPAVVNLASASGEDLTQMCSIVSDALNAFGLSGEKAVNEFADTLAKAATSSNTTVAVMGESLSYVESTAANLGYNIQDVAVALAEMANNALKGSVSGTALNTMLTRMSGANENAAAEMEELGLSMYRTDGTAKDLMTFMNELRDAFRKFGDDAQAAQVAAYNLAGQRGMRGLLSIVNASDEEWKKMTQDVYEYEGAASAISDIRLENYTGQVYLLESAWDALKTTIGEAFLPAATNAAEVLTNLTTDIDKLAQEHETLVVAMGGAATAVMAVTAGVSALGTVAAATKAVVGLLGLEINAVIGAALPVLGIAAAVGAAGGAVLGYATQMEKTESVYDQVIEKTEQTTQATQTMLEGIEASDRGYEERAEQAKGLIAVLDQLQSSDQTNALTQMETAEIVEQLNGLYPELGLEYDRTAGKINTTTDALKKYNKEATDKAAAEDAAERLAGLEAQADSQVQAWREIKQAREQYEAEMQAAYDREMEENGYSFVDTTMQPELENLIQKEEEAKNKSIEIRQQIKETKEETKEYTQAIKEQADAYGLESSVYEEVTAAAEAYGEAYTEAYANAYESFSGMTGLFDEISEKSEITTADIIANQKAQIEQWAEYKDNLETLENSGIDLSAIWDDLSNGSADAMAIASEQARKVKDGVTDELKQMADNAEEKARIVGEAAGAAAQGVAEVQAAAEQIEDAASLNDEKMHEAALQAASDVIAGAVEGLSDFSKVTEAGKQVGDDTIEAICIGLGTHSPSKYTTTAGKDVDQGLVNGMLAKQDEVNRTAQAVAKSATQSFRSGMSQSKFNSYGKSAIQGAINGANSMKSSLVSKFAEMGRAAAQAYKDAQDINSPSKLFYYYSEMDAAGAIAGAEDSRKNVEAAMADMGAGGAEAYAMAVDPRLLTAVNKMRAAPVAEPMTAISNTTQQTNSTPIQLHYNPQITINGGADGSVVDEIKRQLREHEGSLYDQLVKLLERREAANRRRAY